MKIKVTIYNDDPAEKRDIQVIELRADGTVEKTVLEPAGADGRPGNFEILRGDTLIVSATGN